MAAHKQEFRVRDLPTRSVTLFPTQAQIVRDIKDVTLKPGINQVVVVGFSPTVDESSIKVEGTGSAIISDIVVELLPNREIFQDFYPDDDDDKTDTDDDTDDDDDAEIAVPAELKAVRYQIQLLEDNTQRASEMVTSAETRLKFLDAYGKMLDRKRSVEIDVGVETYRVERDKMFTDHMKGKLWLRNLADKMIELAKEETRALKKYNKELQEQARERERVAQARRREKQKTARRTAEETREKQRIKDEHKKYWPRKCYTVRITLDAPSFCTPSSSRRSSISSVTELAKPAASSGEEGAAVETRAATCDLAISYVTSSAFWSPTYDLQLSTTNNTASLCFDAQLTNTTSETWTSCKVVLSTSQTTLSGLNDSIPVLVPWRVKLGQGHSYEAILNSREEVSEKTKWLSQQKAHLNRLPPRDMLFGVPHDFSGFQPQLMRQMAPQTAGLFGRNTTLDNANNTNDLFGSSNNRSGVFGQAMPQQMPQQMMQAPVPSFGVSAFASAPLAHTTHHTHTAVPSGRDDDTTDSDDVDDRTMLPGAAPELGFQESSFEETGMTTTFDLPGLKTLVPSSTASKQRVARISFTGVVFSHTVVAKYKPVAYLRAKLRNASKLTLLKGPAGLTLDGSFMGRTTLPLCSAGDTFSLNLGVDPAIRVAYPKPDVKRATTGIFTKEDSNAYKRSITIANTRAAAGKAITLVVLDQVPVSEDEKLRVELQQPRGLTLSGGAVAAGVGLAAPGKGASAAKDWGTATATLKKAGEIVWDVNLGAGKTVKLDLEYTVSAPTGEGVVQC